MSCYSPKLHNQFTLFVSQHQWMSEAKMQRVFAEQFDLGHYYIFETFNVKLPPQNRDSNIATKLRPIIEIARKIIDRIIRRKSVGGNGDI